MHHDGEPLTAADVAFTIELYRDTEDFPFLPSYAAPFVEVTAEDDTTLVLTTEEPLVTFESYMAFIYVLPQEGWHPFVDVLAIPTTSKNPAAAHRSSSSSGSPPHRRSLRPIWPPGA